MKKAQIIVHMLVINIDIPGVAKIFVGHLLSFVSFNIIDLSPLVRKTLKLNIDYAINQNFYDLGYNSAYFTLNMGNL